MLSIFVDVVCFINDNGLELLRIKREQALIRLQRLPSRNDNIGFAVGSSRSLFDLNIEMWIGSRDLSVGLLREFRRSYQNEGFGSDMSRWRDQWNQLQIGSACRHS